MWTDERIAELKTLWAEGLSASQIARRLGDTTRNAVIGIVHRHGLVGRKTITRMRSRKHAIQAKAGQFPVQFRTVGADGKSAQKIATQKPKGARPPVLPSDGAVLAVVAEEMRLSINHPADVGKDKLTLVDLESHHCRWAIGDPRTEGFHFCGRTKEHQSYCAYHAQRAYSGVSAAVIAARLEMEKAA